MAPSRRRALAGAGYLFTAGLAGCLGLDRSEPVNVTSMEPDHSQETVGNVSAYYPTEGTGIKNKIARLDDEIAGEGQSLSELAPEARRDAILAITRETYYPTRVTADEAGLESGTTLVQYGTKTFGISNVPGSRLQSVEFDRVLTLDPSLSAGELTLTVRNAGQDRYELGHIGRPYFAILCAWDGDYHLLGNEHYGTNDYIVTGDGYAYPTWTDENTRRPDEDWSELPPGDSIAETYVVPEGIDDSAAVYIEMPYRRPPEQSEGSEGGPQLQRVIWYVTIGS
jgi:hypothetical protein